MKQRNNKRQILALTITLLGLSLAPVHASWWKKLTSYIGIGKKTETPAKLTPDKSTQSAAQPEVKPGDFSPVPEEEKVEKKESSEEREYKTEKYALKLEKEKVELEIEKVKLEIEKTKLAREQALSARLTTSKKQVTKKETPKK